ncbi:MAG: PilZ domain-containing protein [Candidatus Hydrogenedentes bacterium]|nr:PilZ domain-containing protein [Candidatus Hydrogenedentota bacterium]
MTAAPNLMREPRTPLNGSFRYVTAQGESTGLWRNISRVGACVELGRYLMPGRSVRLLLNPTELDAVEVEAQVVWCRQVPGRLCFEAGVRIYRRQPETALAFAALHYEAQHPLKRWKLELVPLADAPEATAPARDEGR